MLLLITTAIWLVAVFVKCLRQTVTNICLQRAIRCQKAFDDKDGLKQKAAEAFGLHPEKIQVVAADFVRSPVSYGVFRKTILLPQDYESRYTISEQFLLLLHEMGHIKNRDTVKLQLIDIAMCFIWPVRLMKKHFIQDSEILCDNRVLGIIPEDRDQYSALIVKECSAQQAVKGLGFSDSFYTIKSRLDAVYARRPERHGAAVFAIVVAFTLAGCAVYASRHPAAWLKTSTEEDAVFQKEGEFEVIVRYIDVESGEITSNGAHLLHIPAEVDGQLVEIDHDMQRQTPEYLAVRNTYQYTEGRLRVDKIALYTYLRPYIEEGLSVTEVVFSTSGLWYIDTEREAMLWGDRAGSQRGTGRVYTLSINELERADENNRYASFTCRITRDELIYLFAAHWL